MKRNIDFTCEGFEFAVTDADYDYMCAKSMAYRYSKHTYEKMLQFKADNERDYDYREYDCTGSCEVGVEIIRKGNWLYLELNETKDV